MSVTEQRANIKFCFKLGKSAQETLSMLNSAYGDFALSRSTVFRWYQKFKCGLESIEDGSRSGRPVTSQTEDNIRQIRHILQTELKPSTRLIAKKLNMSRGSAHRLVKHFIDEKLDSDHLISWTENVHGTYISGEAEKGIPVMRNAKTMALKVSVTDHVTSFPPR